MRYLVLALFLVLSSQAFAVDWARVQGKQTTTASGTTTQSLAFTSAVGAGNVPMGTMLMPTGSGLVSIKDNQNNVYLPVVYADDGQNLIFGFYPDPDVNGGLISNAPTTINVTTLNAVSSFFWMNMAEFSPPTGTTAVSLDGSQVASNQAITTTANFQTLNNDVLLFSASYSTGTSTIGAGWTSDSCASATAQCSEYKIQASAGASANATYATQSGNASIVVFGLAPVRRNTWAPVQGVWNHSGVAASSIAASLNNAVGSGNYLFGVVADNSGLGAISSFTDDKGNNYQPTILTPTFNGRGMFWLGPIANGPKTITYTRTSASTLLDLAFYEFRAPPGKTRVSNDAYTNAQPGGASPQNSGNITTKVNGDLLFSMGEPASGAAEPNNSFSLMAGAGSTWGFAYENQQTASASTNASWSYSGTTMNIYLGAFSAIAGGAQTVGPEGIGGGNAVGHQDGIFNPI